ncbi:membrane protein [Comamonas phosphati]|nr:membrane protein [Comamonas phosphati]
MSYGLLITLHLLGAVAFAGTVFFEVVLLAGVHDRVPAQHMRPVEQALGTRATAVMPWVLLVLYTAGAALAWRHRALLAHPLASSMGTLMALKIGLAFSVLGHFFTAMWWRRRGQLNGQRSHRLHLSVFCHVLAIVLLAKAMFYLHW